MKLVSLNDNFFSNKTIQITKKFQMTIFIFTTYINISCSHYSKRDNLFSEG